MSFGFSVGDFVAAGQLAHSIWSRCEAAAGDFEELGVLCNEINIAVGTCQPNDARSILRSQHKEAITRLSASCHTTLKRLEKILDEHQGMNGIQGIGKKLGFIGSKTERDQIRSRLQLHLTTINTFLANVQVETSALTVRLLFSVLQEQFGDRDEATIRGIIDNPDALQDLFKELRSENKLLNAELDREKESIQVKLKAAVENRKQDPGTIVASDVSEAQVARPIYNGPVAPRSAPYDPWSIDWFRDGGHKFLTPITAIQQRQMKRLTGPVMRYSLDEEWLSQLPEGWSGITTTQCRNGKKELAMYYTFNNFPSVFEGVSRKSRAYFFTQPFDYDGMKTFYSLSRKIIIQQEIYKGGLESNPTRGIGFYHNGFPYDLGDAISRLLASKDIGALGTHKLLSADDIDLSLPDDWSYFWQSEDTNEIVYVDNNTMTESTVHPARFNNTEDEVGTHVLPPGWQRRLDTWGNIFFVDHHTRRAVREDPRFNLKINQNTGLPDGWLAIEDHKLTPFFYRRSGRMVFGTYNPAAMKSKSLKDKWTLSRVPEQGEDPESLVEIKTPLARRNFEDQKKARDKAAALAASLVIPPMTPKEEAYYHSVFESVEKEDPFRINYKEALTLCTTFSVSVDLADKVLKQTDGNRDWKWNVDEYAKTLHRIKFELKKKLKDNPVKAKTAKEEKKYSKMFFAGKDPASQTMTLLEFNAVCKGLGPSVRNPEDIFHVTDSNADLKLNVDEFSDAIHLVMHDMKEAKALSKLEPPEPSSLPDTNVTKDQPSVPEEHRSPTEEGQKSNNTGEQPEREILQSVDSPALARDKSLKSSTELDAIDLPLTDPTLLIPPEPTSPTEQSQLLGLASASTPVVIADVHTVPIDDAALEHAQSSVDIVN
ncbi:EF-hand [Glarea lozoyensis ATCC 20868]|uniref:EF-hand n=1 Tax=Glarea lozoyensis (strain ATCC 20868 / MF5171) TaxID=1116229 RepID=S3DHX1_GLAL2|nr:EF-hand [Glarea lozoyensis ATCC 20868]EPE31636.1 EF-hand [Glarea lozoyensis ATCC 20868]